MKLLPTVYTAKNGRKYQKLPNGQCRFVKSSTKSTTTTIRRKPTKKTVKRKTVKCSKSAKKSTKRK